MWLMRNVQDDVLLDVKFYTVSKQNRPKSEIILKDNYKKILPIDKSKSLRNTSLQMVILLIIDSEKST